MLLGPDNLSAQLQPASRQTGGDDVAVHRPVPDVSDISREQRIRLLPVGAIVVEHLPPRELTGLMVTDPPYGVGYDPSWRARRGCGGGRPRATRRRAD